MPGTIHVCSVRRVSLTFPQQSFHPKHKHNSSSTPACPQQNCMSKALCVGSSFQRDPYPITFLTGESLPHKTPPLSANPASLHPVCSSLINSLLTPTPVHPHPHSSTSLPSFKNTLTLVFCVQWLCKIHFVAYSTSHEKTIFPCHFIAAVCGALKAILLC